MALQHLRSSTANKRPDPANMVAGQIAINTNNGSPGLFFEDSNNALVKVGPVHVGTTAPNSTAAGFAGNSIGEQWLDTTSATAPVLKIWDGTAWVSQSGTFVDSTGDTMTGALVMANQNQIRFREATGGGTNFIAIQAPAAVATDKTITLPDITGTLITNADTGTVTSAMILNDTILNADINSAASIAFSKLANVSATDRLLGRSTAGAGAIEEVTCTAAGRALIDDATASDQRTTLGLGTMATQTAANYALLAGPTFTGTPAAPTATAGDSSTQIATTAFVSTAVDAARQGLTVKQSCRVATTANITLSATQTIDGIAVIAGNRVLVKNQTTTSQNGIYVVAAGAWARATDFDATADLTDGAFTFVEEGTANADSGWVLTTDGAITIGTTGLDFAQFSGAGQITAGAGLTKTGNTIDAVGTAGRIVVNADSIDLATAGTAGTYRSVSTDAYGRVTSGTNPTTLTGYGITDAATSTHTHGNITNAGAIGSTANLPIITGTSGVLQAGTFGTAASSFCEGNDARLSNTRNTTNSLTINNGGAGAASGSTFNGGAAVTISHNTIGAAALTASNALSGSNTFTNSTGQTFRRAATQDGILLRGRAGGTSSFNVEVVPGTLTASRTVTCPDGDVTLSTGTMAITGGNLSQFAATTSAQLAGVISDETGSGALVFATSPILVTPAIGTPSSGTLSSCTGLPISTGVSGLGTGVATFLGTPSSANLAAAVTGETGTGALVFASSPTLVTPVLGTPSSGTLTSCTGLPISTGVSGLATGVATFLGTPSSANLLAAVTNETGTGALVFANTPTLVTPVIGAATGTSLVLTGDLEATSINDGPLAGMRNRIINGDMRINQRIPGSFISFNGSGGYTIDRWDAVSQTGTAIGRFEQTTDVPAGFSSSLKYTVSLNDATTSAGDLVYLTQYIEGANVVDFLVGTASAQAVTLSFWVKCSITGTHSGSIRYTDDGGPPAYRSYPFSYTISAANTWEKKTITVPGDTTVAVTIHKGVNTGYAVFFDLGSGSTYEATAGSWSTANRVRATGAVRVVATLNATFFLTGVQLEPGPVATPFERRPIGTELALSQRYYLKTKGMLFSTLTQSNSSIFFPVTMRAFPTAVTTTPDSGFAGTFAALSENSLYQNVANTAVAGAVVTASAELT